MKIGRTPTPPGKKARPPVRIGGQQTSAARSIVDDGQTRGASALKGEMGKALGSTGKGPPSKGKPPTKVKTPKGPGLAMGGMLPGIAGPGPRPPMPLAIGERPQLGKRTQAAMRRRR